MVVKQMNDANDEKYRTQGRERDSVYSGRNGYDASTLAKLAIQKLTGSSRKKALKEFEQTGWTVDLRQRD
jgi:hypothetical protein